MDLHEETTMARPRWIPWAAIAATPLFALGCVPQDRYDSLLTANRSMQEELVTLEDERDEARLNVAALQDQLAQVRGSYSELDARYSRLHGEFEDITSGNDELMRRVASMELGPLPPEIEIALEELASAHPDLLTFDKRQGMLRFASDFTFDLGSVALNAEAQETIRAIARVLSASAASELEARVVGHTDDVRIGKAETLRSHPTNVHLSVHRAISVRDALVNAGLAPSRIQVAGYGEYRPIVANGPRGAAENRRVEIYLAGMPGAVYASPTATTTPVRPAPAAGRAPSK